MAPGRAGSNAQPRARSTARPCKPASGSRGAGCSSGNWFCSNAQFPVRTAQPQAASPDAGAAWPREEGRRVLLHKQPTPGDDRLSWQCFLAQRKPGNSGGRRNFRTARLTLGMLTTSAAIAALFLRPGWRNTLSASKYDFPCPSQLRCFPCTRPNVRAEDHRLHKTRAAEQICTVRSSENDSIFLRPLPPQCAVQGAEAAVLLLLLFSKLHKNLNRQKGCELSPSQVERMVKLSWIWNVLLHPWEVFRILGFFSFPMKRKLNQIQAEGHLSSAVTNPE